MFEVAEARHADKQTDKQPACLQASQLVNQHTVCSIEVSFVLKIILYYFAICSNSMCGGILAFSTIHACMQYTYNKFIDIFG